MILPILGLILLSFIISWIATFAMRRVSPRIGFVDRPGNRKIHINPKPLGGGVAIVLGFALPILLGISFIELHGPPAMEASSAPRMTRGGVTTNSGIQQSQRDRLIAAYWSGARQRAPLVLGILVGVLLMHGMGLWDDRRALGPYTKLLFQLGLIVALVTFLDLRVLTTLDHLGLGRAPSIIVTVLWIAMITNAFNFLDNMDGLSAGVGAVAAAAFLITTLSIQQWFVAAGLALLLGSLLGFLCFNFSPASIFMGDSGSLVVGLLLGIMTVRTTYLPQGEDFGAGWYAVFAPVIVLAVPVYDLLVVSAIRISRGKSPFMGDTNHFSHRLVDRGMSRRNAVLCIYLITAATAVAAIILPHVRSSFVAIAIFAQTLLILGVVAMLEQHPLPGEASAAIVVPPSETAAPANALEPQTPSASTVSG